MGLFSGSGLTPSLKGVVSNVVALKAGQVEIISPAGWYGIRCGLYSTIQQYDPITMIWRNIGGGVIAGGMEYIYSDGVNYRLANQNGCVVGAAITNVGSGYLTAPAVTASAGGSLWRAVIGGAVNQTVTVTNGGVNYTYPPIVAIAAPPAGGVQATGYCTLTTGVVTSVTIIDQGAGYASAPVITFFNDPREGLNGTTVGYNAAAIATLTGAGTITALLCIDHGNPIASTAGSATALPTLTISPALGSAAASPIMDWSIIGIVSSGYNAGAGITAPAALITGVEVVNGTVNATVLNPTLQRNLVKLRLAMLYNVTTGSALGAYNSATTVYDGGIYTGTPLAIVETSPSTTVTTAPVVTFTMGGYNDVNYLTQI
jgi:hypothetical protein